MKVQGRADALGVRGSTDILISMQDKKMMPISRGSQSENNRFDEKVR